MFDCNFVIVLTKLLCVQGVVFKFFFFFFVERGVILLGTFSFTKNGRDKRENDLHLSTAYKAFFNFAWS